MRIKLLLLLGLSLLISSCAQRRAERFVEQLKSNDKETRINASYKLLLIGKPAVEPLIKVLQTGDERTRFIAVQLLGKIGDPHAVEPLIDMLKERSVPIREKAVEALGKMADYRCVDPLIERLLFDPEPSVRAQAAESLGILRYIEAEDALLEALQDTNAVVRKNALIALERFWDSALYPVFVKMTKDPDDEVRYVAVQILGHIRFEGALKRLIQLLEDEVPAIRQEAAYALGEMRDERAVRPLLNMMVEYDGADREAAKKALKKITGAEYEVIE